MYSRGETHSVITRVTLLFDVTPNKLWNIRNWSTALPIAEWFFSYMANGQRWIWRRNYSFLNTMERDSIANGPRHTARWCRIWYLDFGMFSNSIKANIISFGYIFCVISWFMGHAACINWIFYHHVITDGRFSIIKLHIIMICRSVHVCLRHFSPKSVSNKDITRATKTREQNDRRGGGMNHRGLATWRRWYTLQQIRIFAIPFW